MTVEYLHLRPGQTLPTKPCKPFRAIILAEQDIDTTWRDQTAAWIVATGCLYAIAWGVACEAWHDSVDRANLETFNFGEIPDDRFVMTTWHADEPLSEAFWFAGNCASHPAVELNETVIIHIASEPREAELRQSYIDGQHAADDYA